MLTNTLQPHGLDLHQPGALTQLFELRRRTFGSAVMNGEGTGTGTSGTGDGGSGSGTGEGTGSGSSDDLGFPKDTSVKDMKVEEQSAYWRHQARKHEDRVKAFGDLTPEQARQLKKDIEENRTKSLTEQERAVELAKEAGRAEVRSVLGQERARNAFEKALAGRAVDPGAMLGLNLADFIDGEKAKTDDITKWVTEHSTESSTQEKRTFPQMGQGKRGQATATPGDGGRAEAARRFKKE